MVGFLFFIFLFSLASAETIEEKSLNKEFIIDASREKRVGYLYIGDHEQAIDQSTWLYVKEALNFYKEHPPLFIILDLNTPGGEVFAAQKISDALREMDFRFQTPIFAFIHDWALSAGAMLAYSCRFIAPVKGASMGAAEPVLLNESGKMEAASEKINSALRADFANRAEFFGRNPLIAEAMVDKDMILVWRQGKVVRLENENQIHLVGDDPDEVIARKGKLLTLRAEEMLQFGVADAVLNNVFTSPSLDKNSTQEENAAKIALETIKQMPFLQGIDGLYLALYEMDWKTHFFVFLATPWVSSLLLMGLFIGGYMELSQPGLTFPGLIAGTCLFFMLLSHFSLQLGEWLEVILLISGAALLLLEVLVFPTFGALAFLGLILLMGGLLGILIPGLNQFTFSYDPTLFYAASDYFINRLKWVSGALLVSLICIVALGRYVLPRFGFFSPLVLKGGEQDSSLGFTSGIPAEALPPVGSTGHVATPLGPVGKVEIGGHFYESLSQEGWIEPGALVEVLAIRGNLLVVTRKVTV